MARAFDVRSLRAEHRNNRAWAANVAPDINRCAFVLSKNLGIKPTGGEHSLADVNEIAPSSQGQDWLRDYFVQAQEPANRIERDWGTPTPRMEARSARTRVQDRLGMIFFEDAYRGSKFWKGKYIDHIDLWDGRRTGSGHVPFDTAERVGFREILDALGPGDFPLPDPKLRHV